MAYRLGWGRVDGEREIMGIVVFSLLCFCGDVMSVRGEVLSEGVMESRDSLLCGIWWKLMIWFWVAVVCCIVLRAFQ